MKNFLFLLLLSVVVHSQTFEQSLPDTYRTVDFQVDLMGSIDKQGLNSVLSFTGPLIDINNIEIEIQVQTTFNGDRPADKLALTYLDVLFGPGYRFNLSNRHSLIIGAHMGGLFRPKDVIIHESYSGFAGYFIYGPTIKGRWWLGKNKTTFIVMSGSYDYAPDVKEKWGRINGRAGIGIRI